MIELYRACQRLHRRLADDRFRDDDRRARARGWTVEPIHGGTGRRYRDPRFDFLHECSTCRGAGYLGIEACTTCGGRGVVDTRATRPTERIEPAPAALETHSEPSSNAPEPLRVTAERMDRTALCSAEGER
jgi:hypothetical protein